MALREPSSGERFHQAQDNLRSAVQQISDVRALLRERLTADEFQRVRRIEDEIQGLAHELAEIFYRRSTSF
jgi:hypothetical protein